MSVNVTRQTVTTTVERVTGTVDVTVSAAATTVAMPQVGSLWLSGHSFLDAGSIDEGGAGLPLMPGRIAEAFRVPSSRVTNSAVFGARARYSGWWQVLQSYNPGAASWPFSAQVGLWVTAFGTNDARDGVGSADGWQECSFKASMEAIVARFRAGAVFEDSHSSCVYTGTWSTVTPATDESATTTQCSGSTYRKTTTANSKVTITTPNSMGRNVDGVWVSIGLQGAESGAKVQIKLDGVHHGYVDVGRGADYGTSFGSTSNAVGYRIGLVYRLWIPTTYTDADELYTTEHTIEVIHVSNVGSGGVGLIFDYWSIEASGAPLGVVLNVPQPADSSTAGGAFSDTTVATTYNTWLAEVAAGFTVDDTGLADDRVQVGDLWSAFGGRGWTELSNREFYGTDRLHPNADGAKVAARVVQRCVARALRSVDPVALLGWWPDAIEPLTEAPTVFFADGTPLVVVDDFERTASEDALGGDGVEQVGAWGVDVFGQAYLVDALFSHWSERDDFGRDDSTSTFGSVEYDSTDPGNPGAWVAQAGTWGISSGAAYLSAKPGSGHAVATRDLGSTTQALEVLFSNVDTDLVSVAKYGVVFRYVDSSNYLLLSYGGVTAYLSKMVGGVLTNIGSITSVGSRPHVEVGTDDVVHFWSAANGTHSAVTYTITDAALQAAGAGTKVGLWVASDAAAGLTGRFDAWRAGTTLADADAQSSTRSLVTWDLGTPDGVLAFEQGATEDDSYSFTGGPGLIYRYQDDLNYYRLDFSLSAIYGVATLYKVVAGTATSLGSWWTPLGAGIVHAISFDGSTHALYHDGVASSRTTSGTTITDSTFTTGNLHGIQAPYTATTSNARWRDIRFGQTVGDVAVRGDVLFDTSPASAIDVYQLVDGSWVERGSLDAAGVGADPAGTAAALVDDLSGVTDASTARTNLGLGSLATLSAVGSAQITDGSIVAGDLSASAAVALSQLATQATGTFVGNVSGSTAVPSAVSAASTLAALSGVAAAAFSFNAQDVTAGRLGVNASAWSTVEKLRVNTPTTADTTANVILSASAASAKPLVLQGAASQAVNVLEIQDSTGVNRFGVVPFASGTQITSASPNDFYFYPRGTISLGITSAFSKFYTYLEAVTASIDIGRTGQHFGTAYLSGGRINGGTGAMGTVEKLRVNTPTTVDNSANVMLAASATTVTPAVVQLAASHTDSAIEVQGSTGAVLASITAAGLHKWSSGNEQTTVGAAGAASALPATPTKYLKVVDSGGTTLVIPAYAAA